ncbi:hypothetical protein QNI19_17810 [Cytophagaceae bacterium DM2B3-1]|uniref:Uncharacterized protein n=1 Tax=Xanthocytophaga flava TaxID=3048013 RepID=A0AAE3U569_9BACT|nr:hypothetical protein [Xanthocytophaga flavus]MDJ1467293.1 hypothetical protein [Xanthocytophaga flavus]MDJ1479971.1 hypothetical protein [Xanthocytophaga flavus]MDJ1494800.1 hypothetical protein [Xanthocytophaga flavus]
MKISFLHYALILSLTFGFSSCTKSTSSGEQTEQTKDTVAVLDTVATQDTVATTKDCSGDVMCTRIFMTVSATVKNKDNSPVQLDSYKIIQTATGTERKPTVDAADAEMQRQSGAYPIVTDANVKELANKEIEVEFIGYKAGKELVKRKLTVGADCCHVKHIAGELDIVLDK